MGVPFPMEIAPLRTDTVTDAASSKLLPQSSAPTFMAARAQNGHATETEADCRGTWADRAHPGRGGPRSPHQTGRPILPSAIDSPHLLLGWPGGRAFGYGL